MVNRLVAPLLMSAFAAFFGVSLALPMDGDTCNLQILYYSSTASYQMRCRGVCVPDDDPGAAARVCELASYTGPSETHWWCTCNEDEDPDQIGTKCHGAFRRSNAGVYSITCVKNGCVNECLKPALPPAKHVWTWTCNCPDAP